MKGSLKLISAALLAAGLTLLVATGFKEPPSQSGDNEATALASRRGSSDSGYPQFASGTFHYRNKEVGYEGGNLKLPTGTTLHFKQGALTPPPGTPRGADIRITMLVEKDTTRNQLVLTFGPSGCQFNPPAEVWFDWSDLNTSNGKLCYIDNNGNSLPQPSSSIDFQKRRVLLHIDHFSRYALAAE